MDNPGDNRPQLGTEQWTERLCEWKDVNYTLVLTQAPTDVPVVVHRASTCSQMAAAPDYSEVDSICPQYPQVLILLPSEFNSQEGTRHRLLRSMWRRHGVRCEHGWTSLLIFEHRISGDSRIRDPLSIAPFSPGPAELGRNRIGCVKFSEQYRASAFQTRSLVPDALSSSGGHPEGVK